MIKRFFLGSLFFLFSLMMVSCAKDSTTMEKSPDEELKRCIHIVDKKKDEEGIECLELLKARFPRSTAGMEAELKIGDIYFQKKDYLLAAETYVGFLKLYSFSPRVDYAYYRAGTSYYLASPKSIDRDQEYIDDAIEHLKIVINRYQQSAYRGLATRFLKEAERRVVRRNYYVGRFYYRTGEYIAAIPRFEEAATKTLDENIATKSLYLAIVSHLKLKNIEAAKEIYGKLSAEHPKSKWTAKAQKRLLRSV